MTECPYCLDEIRQPDETATCAACGAVYHIECWVDNDGCCVRECSAAKHCVELDIPASVADGVVVTEDEARQAIPHVARKAWNPCLRCGRHLPPAELYCRECQPSRDESQDSRNVGPMLVVLLLVVLAIGSMLAMGRISDNTQKQNPTEIETGLKR